MTLSSWSLPSFEARELHERKHAYCIGIPVRDEGERIQRQLQRMQALNLGADLVLADGGSDGSCEVELMRSLGVRTLLENHSGEGLGSQLRLLFSYALQERYEGIVLLDGNGKDDVHALPDFLDHLGCGFDFIQGSRFIPGGRALHNPWHRLAAITLLHAPIISLAAGFPYTDTTNGFRAFSARFLFDERVAPFRACFSGYELHYYLAIKAARLGYRVIERPVTRTYPATGPIPTKIRGLKGNLKVMRALLDTVAGRFDPDQN